MGPALRPACPAWPRRVHGRRLHSRPSSAPPPLVRGRIRHRLGIASMSGRLRLNWAASCAGSAGARSPSAIRTTPGAARPAWVARYRARSPSPPGRSSRRAVEEDQPAGTAPRNGRSGAQGRPAQRTRSTSCRVDVQRDRQQQAFALPQSRQRFEFAAFAWQASAGNAVQLSGRASEAAAPATSRLLCRSRPAAGPRHRVRLPPTACVPSACSSADTARAATAAAARAWHGHRDDQRHEPVVEVVETLDVVDDALVGPQRAGGQRLRAPAG